MRRRRYSSTSSGESVPFWCSTHGSRSKLISGEKGLEIEFPAPISEAESERHAEIVVRVATTESPFLYPSGEVVYSISFDTLFTISELQSGGQRRVAMEGPVTENERHELCMVHILNHTLGDGSTFYRINAMLSASLESAALDPTRPKVIEELENPNYLRSCGMICGVVRRLLRVSMGCSANGKTLPRTTEIWLVAKEEVARIKDQASIDCLHKRRPYVLVSSPKPSGLRGMHGFG